MSEQKSLVESKGIKKNVTLFETYHCRKCGSSTVFVYNSNDSICLKCDDCNERAIFSVHDIKKGALEELKELVNLDSKGDIFIDIEGINYICKRIKKLEEEKTISQPNKTTSGFEKELEE